MNTDPEKISQNQPVPNKSGGGIFLAFGCIAGVLVGGLLGQPSIGFLTGLGLGAAIAFAIWYFDR